MNTKIDYSKLETASAVPEASSMIETFRAIGYNLETAIADIVDNSISAGAKNISIYFEWKGSETWLAIKDDGVGMNNPELIQAMRPGSKNPLDKRDSKDLGRFGLGLKTASFSQCRILSVISKKENYRPVYWSWILDAVKETGDWSLIKYLPKEDFQNEIDNQLSGTIVIWNEIDRLVKNFRTEDEQALNKFLETMKQVKTHLAMVFHRFIENGKLKIFFQDRLIEPWNPFLANENATQGFPEEPFYSGLVIAKGYVLPHNSKISESKFKESAGPKGWNEQQGFYIYRNDRLLLGGDWLGLFRKEEHYKLARIEINLPNNFDSEWHIDIKKSIARTPLALRDQLKAYAGKVRAQAVEVYRHRGKTVKPFPGQQFIPLWIDHKRGDKWFYKINREHPLIDKAINQAATEPKKAIENLIRFIEETVPSKSIYIKEASDEDAIGKPFEGIDQEPIRKVMKQMYEKLVNEGKTDEQAKSIIFNIDPFNLFPHLLEFIN